MGKKLIKKRKERKHKPAHRAGEGVRLKTKTANSLQAKKATRPETQPACSRHSPAVEAQVGEQEHGGGCLAVQKSSGELHGDVHR